LNELKVSKLAIGTFSIEFAETKGFEPNLKIETAGGLFDLRNQPGVPIERSGKETLLAQIKQGGNRDFAIFDLGKGKNWLSTRLFLFTIVLADLFSLRRIIFLYTKGDVSNYYLGTAEPKDIRSAFSKVYPWLDDAFADAYIETWKHLSNNQVTSKNSIFGSINDVNANFIIHGFLKKVQVKTDNITSEKLSINLDSWTNLKDERWEHGEWMTHNKLEDILDGALDKSSILESDLTMTNEKQLLYILSSRGQYIPILEEDRRFEKGKIIDKFAVAIESFKQILLKS
jgi:hypothetical protein